MSRARSFVTFEKLPLRFRIYSDAAGPLTLFDETLSAVNVESGYYTAALGRNAANPLSLASLSGVDAHLAVR